MGNCAEKSAKSRPPPGSPPPPHQADPWVPPSNALPAVATSAIATLFDQGLADPRGLSYRTITLRVRSAWGSEQTRARAQLILTPAFAVAWNGLVVPIEEAGDAANTPGGRRADDRP